MREGVAPEVSAGRAVGVGTPIPCGAEQRNRAGIRSAHCLSAKREFAHFPRAVSSAGQSRSDPHMRASPPPPPARRVVSRRPTTQPQQTQEASGEEEEAEDSSCGACVCLMKTLAAQIPSSYSTIMGIASASCETTSGGVTMAAMMKASTMK